MLLFLFLPLLILADRNIHEKQGSKIPRVGVDFIGPLWLPRTYKITCCRGGTAQADNVNLISNWTETASDYAIDEQDANSQNEHCRVYEGSFLLSATALFNFSFTGYGVHCKCPESPFPLDRYCRSLPNCLNGGYRSRTLGGVCTCNEQNFGELCEKTCDQGQILKGVDGRSYCSCLPFYQGEECNEMVCLNGGTLIEGTWVQQTTSRPCKGVEVHGRCSCPASYLGYHCEVDSNRTTHTGNRFQRFGENSDVFNRDISGTVFSLVMIVVLVVSMYLLMKHRMQVQSRFAASRREEMARAAAVYGIPHSSDPAGPSADIRIAPFVAAGIEGPPPYMQRETRRNRRNEILPPLPSYEDATKELPMRPWSGTEIPMTTVSEEASSSSDSQLEETPISRSAPTQPIETAEPTTTDIPFIERKISTRRSF